MKKLKIPAITFSILSGASLAFADCHCKHAGRHETTRWGGNEAVLIVEEAPQRLIRGTVTFNHPDEPQEDALVEIFTHGEYLLKEGPPDPNAAPQKRIAACVTGPDGKFCFAGLNAGVYELRSSIGSGINVTHVYVKVDPKSKVSKELVVTNTVGT